MHNFRIYCYFNEFNSLKYIKQENKVINMLNQKETEILSILRQNSRTSLANISRKTNIPISTVFDIIRKQEKNHIQKYTSLLNFPKLGYHVRVNFAVKVMKENEKNLFEFIEKETRINNVQKISSGFYIDAVFTSMKEFSEFSEKLDTFNLKEKKEIHIIEELKKEAFMT